MRIIRTVEVMSSWSRARHRQGQVIGLVPTMGALHDGHRALIKAARSKCDVVVVSLFVNPRQFGRGEDLVQYPRQITADAALCRRENVDVLFRPARPNVYPSNFQTSISVRKLSRRWEGENRPGHFEGVALIVTKLLSLVRPDRAFFGQKDFQQAVVVRRLIEDLNLGARIVVCPTVREPDGLALSSRNGYLSSIQRRAASVLYRALRAGGDAIRTGTRSGARIRKVMRQVVGQQPQARIDYLAVCDPDTLEPLERITHRTILLGAIRVGRTRLIDNILIKR